MQVLARVQVLRDKLSVVWAEAIEWPWGFCNADNANLEINDVRFSRNSAYARRGVESRNKSRVCISEPNLFYGRLIVK